MDIYGNFLVEFATEDGDEVIDLQSNPRGATSQDDLYVAALTESGAFYVFHFEVVRVDNWKEIHKMQKKGEVLVDQDGSEKARLTDLPYSRSYKQIFHQYEYMPKYPDSQKTRLKNKRKKQQK